MASKLFHAVVGFGISLGAMSVGCASPTVEESSSTEAAQIEGDGAQADAGTTDRFCEVAWPTTKGGPRPQQAIACTDPARECGPYPGEFFNYPTCRYETTAGQCDSQRKAVWMFCKTGEQGEHEWACPSGTKLATECSAGAPTQ